MKTRSKIIYPIEETIWKEKIIAFNQEQKILVLDDGRYIKLPKNIISSKGYSTDFLQTLFLIDPNKKIELLTMTFSYKIFKEKNNKLNDASREIIQKYYAYHVEFISEQIDKIWNNQTLITENRIPYLLDMEQFLKLKTPYVSEEDQQAVKLLQKKLNYEK